MSISRIISQEEDGGKSPFDHLLSRFRYPDNGQQVPSHPGVHHLPFGECKTQHSSPLENWRAKIFAVFESFVYRFAAN